MKTLVVVDVQNDFMPGGALEVPGADQIVGVINDLINQFDLIVATQDWHPEHHKSFASNHENRKHFEKINLHGTEQVLWPEHCVQDSFGADFHPELMIDSIDAVFQKGVDPEIDSYSGFYDNEKQKSTGLADYLKDKGVNDLYFCGLAADICVYYSIKDALDEGFRCCLVENASRPLNTSHYELLKKELISLGVTII